MDVINISDSNDRSDPNSIVYERVTRDAVWNEMQNDTITNIIEQNWVPNNPKTNKVDGINFYNSIYYGEHFRLIIQRNKNTQKLYFGYEIH